MQRSQVFLHWPKKILIFTGIKSCCVVVVLMDFTSTIDLYLLLHTTGLGLLTFLRNTRGEILQMRTHNRMKTAELNCGVSADGFRETTGFASREPLSAAEAARAKKKKDGCYIHWRAEPLMRSAFGDIAQLHYFVKL